MIFTQLTAAFTALIACVDALPSHPTPPKGKWPGPWGGAKTLYFMTNEVGVQNQIVALPIGNDGYLYTSKMTASGGVGGAQIANATTGALFGPDALGSQGSVQAVDGLVFNVNPGSNTISSLAISWKDPTDLTLLTTVSTNGDFPNCIGVSSKLKIACVGNTGSLSGVSCASYSEKGISSMDDLRTLPFGQTTPPVGPTNGIAQVLFNDDSTELIVVVKGDGMMPDTGYIATYPVVNGEVSYTPTKVSPTGTAVMFGSALIPDTENILVSDAGFGAVILSLENLATPLASTNITNQKATCWAIISPFTGTGFVDDVAVSHLVEIDLTTGAIISDVPNGNNDQGMLDMRVNGDKLYGISPGNGTLDAAVTVFDLSDGPISIQNFFVPGAGRFSDGLAIYP